jgi:hypothetical protein
MGLHVSAAERDDAGAVDAGHEGFNSSAMSISDSLGGALALAATGIVFAAFTTTAASFAGVFVLTAVLAAAAVAIAPRVAH